MNDDKLPKPHKTTLKSKKGDKIEVVRMLIIATVSFLVGFALVYLLLMPSQSDESETSETASQTPEETSEEQASSAPSASGYAPDEGQVPQNNQAGYASPAEEEELTVSEGDLPPEVPPGKTPDSVTLDGSAFYLKCWDENGIEHKGSECDKLSVLEKRFSTRLYVVDKCRIEKAGDSAQGKLSVAAEVDFQALKVSFWSGASSDLKDATQVGTCLREALAGLPIHGVDHKFSRYRIFFTVLFGKAAEKKQNQEEAAKASFVSGKGRLVNVAKDRVRVRKTPVDGDIIGKISTGSQVRFLKKKDGWCNVVTPNGNQGWMICDALEL